MPRPNNGDDKPGNPNQYFYIFSFYCINNYLLHHDQILVRIPKLIIAIIATRHLFILCAEVVSKVASHWTYYPYLGQHFPRIQVSKLVKSHTKSVSSTVTTLENYSFSSAGFEPTSSAREPESKTTMLLRHLIKYMLLIVRSRCRWDISQKPRRRRRWPISFSLFFH